MNSFASDVSRALPRQRPLEVAPETFVIRASMPAGGALTSLNSMIIRGAEPIIVDTGDVTGRETWFEDVFSLVEPGEVRWIFLTHGDSDHSGNLVEALERCPNATMIITRGESFRLSPFFGIPLDRMRPIDEGEALDVGDRTLRPLRPPVYDSPYTRGLFDPRTNVYYASDAFCSPMPAEPVDTVADMPARMWTEGMARFHHHALCPWIAMVDQAKFHDEVRKLSGLGIEVIVGSHTAVINGSAVARAFEEMAKLPTATPPPIVLPVST